MRRRLVPAVLLAAAAPFAFSADAPPECYAHTYHRYSGGTCQTSRVCVISTFTCAKDEQTSSCDDACACAVAPFSEWCGGDDAATHCPFGIKPKAPCPNGELVDNGAILHACKDEGCQLGEGACTCTAACDNTQLCGPKPQQARCDPLKPERTDSCGSGSDANCDGTPDDGCAPPAGPDKNL